MKYKALLENIPNWVVAGLGYFCIILMLWLPVGLKPTGIFEEWRGRAYVDGGYDSIGAYNILLSNDLKSRPTSILPAHLAYLMTPDSFVGNHLIAIALLLTKSLALYFILKLLFPEYELVAFFVGALFVVYPADTGIVSLRVLHYHASIGLLLIAIYLLLRHWEKPNWMYMIMIWVALASCLFMVEAAYPVVFLAPALLLFKSPRITRRFIWVTFLWYVVPAMTFSYTFYVLFLSNVSWQSNIIDTQPQASYVTTMLGVYYTNLIGSWRLALEQFVFRAGVKELAIVSFGSGIAVLCGFWFAAFRQSSTRMTLKKLLLIVFASLALIGAAFALFLITNRSQATFRVFLLTSLGAAIFWGYLLFAISMALTPKYGKILYVLGMSLLICLAINRHIFVHYGYAKQSQQEGLFMSQVTRLAPEFQSPTYVLFLPANNGSDYIPTDFTSQSVFISAFKYIYNDYEQIVGAFFCSPVIGQCELEDDGVFIVDNFNTETRLPYADLVIFSVDTTGFVQLVDTLAQSEAYQPLEHINTDAAPPDRMQMFDVP